MIDDVILTEDEIEDLQSQSDPVCPYCGYVERDSWEISSDAVRMRCSSCDKHYGIEQEHSRTFSSWKTCQPNQPHSFGPWDPYGSKKQIRRCSVCGVCDLRSIEVPNE